MKKLNVDELLAKNEQVDATLIRERHRSKKAAPRRKPSKIITSPYGQRPVPDGSEDWQSAVVASRPHYRGI